MRGVEPLSENLLIRLSPWAVCYLEFPLVGANKHAPSAGSPFLLDRFKGEKPMQVHRSSDAQSKVAVLLGGTGDPQVTALLSLPPFGEKLRQPLQQYCCRLFFKVRQLSRLPGSPRLSYLKIPVETIAPPYRTIIHQSSLFVNGICSPKSQKIPSATPYSPFA